MTEAVNPNTYLLFIAIMLIGTVFSWTLCEPGEVSRPDGSMVVITQLPEVWTHIRIPPAAVDSSVTPCCSSFSLQRSGPAFETYPCHLSSWLSRS